MTVLSSWREEEANTSQSTGRDLLSDWLCMIVNPIACFGFEHELLPVFAKHEMVISLAISTFQSRKPLIKADLSTLNGFKLGRADLIHGERIILKMTIFCIIY
jgi:hypothetical protein